MPGHSLLTYSRLPESPCKGGVITVKLCGNGSGREHFANRIANLSGTRGLPGRLQIRGYVSTIQYLLDGAIDGTGLVDKTEAVLQHSGDRANCAQRIRLVLPGDVGCRAMNRLIQTDPRARWPPVPNGSRWEHANGTRQHCSFITQDIAEQVFREHDIEPPGIQDQLHCAVIHQNVIERHAGITRCYFRHDTPPKLRVLENVRFIDAGHFLPPLARKLEAHVRDTLDFG